ncbi:MAG: MoxR family ATPase [Planctomycetes bacterium]|nr:MoxR family ATPase [Planctomycetota bacterium]
MTSETQPEKQSPHSPAASPSGPGRPPAVDNLLSALGNSVVGQDDVVRQVLASLLAEGHALIVGVPGLAKTLLVRSLAALLSLDFKRIQFTPDLMPSDITGTTLIGADAGGQRAFRFLPGPLFANIVLADEINRTPPKTQAALMEAMEERQVTAAGQRLPLPRPFFVLATQNPIEQEGTYPLPVSQLDRFLFQIDIDYPTEEEEFRVVQRTTSAYDAPLASVISRERILEMIARVRAVAIPLPLIDYASRIVRQTRPHREDAPAFVRETIAWGAGPRAVQSMLLAGKSLAFLDGRSEVSYDDLHAIVHPALRHRLVLTYHAEAESLRVDDLIDRVIESLPDGRYRRRPAGAGARKGLFARILSRK